MHETQAVLFDLDGTLVNTSQDILYALNTLLAEHQLPPCHWKDIESAVPLGATAIIEQAFPESKISDDLSQRFRDLRSEHLIRQTQPYDGIPQLLKTIQQHGMRLAVVSNNFQKIISKILDHTQLDDYFELVLGQDDVNAVKPSPEPLLHACSLLQLAPTACIYVGDFEIDVMAAKAAGMPSIAVSYGFNDTTEIPNWHADFIAHTSLDIENFLYH